MFCYKVEVQILPGSGRKGPPNRRDAEITMSQLRSGDDPQHNSFESFITRALTSTSANSYKIYHLKGKHAFLPRSQQCIVGNVQNHDGCMMLTRKHIYIIGMTQISSYPN
ncbi:unnamed protein product [Musa banksii]